MPLENTPDTSRIEQPGTPEWINKWEASISLHKSNLPSMEQVRAMTNVALDAASSHYVSGHVENYTFVNTPEVVASQPVSVEVPKWQSVSEQALGGRLFEEFRPVALGEKELELFAPEPIVPEPVNPETITRQDLDLAA